MDKTDKLVVDQRMLRNANYAAGGMWASGLIGLCVLIVVALIGVAVGLVATR